MLDKKMTTTGKIYTAIGNLQVWDKNPRTIADEDRIRLRSQIAFLGQYKPLLVTEDGIVVGGNMRLSEFNWLNTNIFVYNDIHTGREMQLDLRGSFNDVWISELSFGQEELTDEQKAEGVMPKYRAIIDGKTQPPRY